VKRLLFLFHCVEAHTSTSQLQFEMCAYTNLLHFLGRNWFITLWWTTCWLLLYFNLSHFCVDDLNAFELELLYIKIMRYHGRYYKGIAFQCNL